MPADSSPSLVVSLHDIAPATFATARRQMDELAGQGVTRISLLVVPYHHRQQRIGEEPKLCEWLRDRQSQGHEIVLHGFSHQLDQVNVVGRSACPEHNRRARPPLTDGAQDGRPTSFAVSRPAQTLRDWFLENLYTNREAEFLNSDYTTARSRIEAGLKSFQELGFQAAGFIAPAWLMNPEVERAAHDLGMLYTNTLTELVHLPSGRRHPTRSCVWSTRAAWRRTCSLAWNARLFRRLVHVDPLRISIHPSDRDYPAIWAQIQELVGAALSQRRPTTYAAWISSR